MNYQETLDWLFNQLPMYQNLGKKAYKKDLSNTLLLMNYLGHPEKNLKCIHVAGTNGKGSTCHMIASVLQEEGYQVGLYTSPHLVDFRERIKVSGTKISASYIVSFFKKHKAFFEQNNLSFFEMTVGLSFQYFKDKDLDYVVLETGLGGRLDSTNVVHPILSVITNIGLDHVEFLGNTLAKIAAEKAGIIKNNVPVVIGEYHEETFDVFQDTAIQNQATLHRAFELKNLNYQSDLKGIYQQKNIKTAVKVVEVLKELEICVSEASLKKGLANVVSNTGLLGRYQLVQNDPKVICDTAHNKEGLSLVMEQLLQEKYQQLFVVLGFVSDKDLSSVLPVLPKKVQYFFTKPSSLRGLSELTLQQRAEVFGLKGESYGSVKEAAEQVMKKAGSKDLVFIGGSTFVVADYLIYKSE